ncbi:MAG: TetR/AcrR family transcriptional regulator [Phycisphaerales bacterium]|nr:TetR/AcrR family transcriptional regulator [Hyphomonadaceae bacterium]
MTTVTLRARKKQATRARLADAAIRLIATRGVDAVTIEDIARSAEVGKGTLYNYYSSKDDILLDFLAGVEAATLPRIAAAPVSGRSLALILNGAAWALLECKAPHHALARVVLARLASGDASFNARAEAFSAAILAAFATLFEKLKRAKLIEAHWDAHDLALRFTVMHMGLSLFWAMDAAPFANSRRVTKAQTEIFAKGIGS